MEKWKVAKQLSWDPRILDDVLRRIIPVFFI